MNTPERQIASERRGLEWFALNYRWTICALLFFAAVINYVDRQIIGILKPVLQAELGWDEIAYSNIVFWFQVAYAIDFVSIGLLMDWLS